MNDIFAIIAILSLALILIAVPGILYLVFHELRAIRKVLQARWDYRRFVRLRRLESENGIESHLSDSERARAITSLLNRPDDIAHKSQILSE